MLGIPDPTESARLQVLHDYAILDTPPEAFFDDLIALAAELCATPTAVITFVDHHRQWFKSVLGLDLRETPRAFSFCDHTIRGGLPLIVSDLLQDLRFQQNPLVVEAPFLRFYAGVPLISPEGVAIGSIAVFDRVPRSLSSSQLRSLETLARLAMDQLEQRIQKAAQAHAYPRAELETQRLAAFARFNPNPVLELSAQGAINYFNDATGKMARDLGHSHPREILPPETAAIVGACLATGLPRLRLETHSGERTISWSFFPIRPLNTVHCYAGDITARKDTEERLREQAALLDKSQDAILVRDLDHRITYWNKSAERVYGWTADETLGRSVLDLLKPESRAFQQAHARVLQSGEWIGELQKTDREGRTRTIEARWTLVCSDDNRPQGILAINTDITEKKKLEQQFLRSQRMESIGTLAGGMAHDLNNVLAPITMGIDLLSMSTADPESLKTLATMATSAQRATDMIGQVLSYARGMDGQRIQVAAKTLVREIEKIIRETFPRNIQIDVRVQPELWTLTGDPTQLHQVLLNLCVNARDALTHGGRITLRAENTRLDDHYAAMNMEAKTGDYLTIEVEDNGTGIPSAIIEKIFDPFFTTKPLGKGTGLGLSTTLAIVKSHGGFIRVYSEPEKGSRFRVYLPAKAQASQTNNFTFQTAAPPKGRGETVLVVDDEAPIRTIMQQTLEAHGYRVLLAADGSEAVALYAAHRSEIAVVLTDMMMPVMDGAATIHALGKIDPQVRIIAASGIAANSNVVSTPGGAVKCFLAKPYTAERLLNVLRDVLATPR